MAEEYTYVKKISPFNDVVDSLRLCLRYYVPQQQPINSTAKTIEEAINNIVQH
jgi:hypothetical protein